MNCGFDALEDLDHRAAVGRAEPDAQHVGSEVEMLVVPGEVARAIDGRIILGILYHMSAGQPTLTALRQNASPWPSPACPRPFFGAEHGTCRSPSADGTPSIGVFICRIWTRDPARIMLTTWPIIVHSMTIIGGNLKHRGPKTKEMLKRRSTQYLSQWLEGQRRRPLVIRGARQVGKSTLVRDFAKSAKRRLHEINLEKNTFLERTFATLDLGTILRELGGVLGHPIRDKNDILFLDEIQATPHALQALRYFHEEKPALPVLAAGSLLEFTLSDHDFSMPVGRIQYLHMGPMAFEEFLEAIDPELTQYLHEYEWGRPFPDSVHRRLLARQREYLLIGGMPEAVAAYLDDLQLADVTPIQSLILSTYSDDFPKYASGKALARLQTVFDYVPRRIGEKLKYTNISRDETARDLRHAVELLSKARVMTQVFHSDCNGLPLFAEADPFTFKPLFLDVGLMNRHCGLDWLAISALSDRSLVNEGAIAEQFIGQHLLLSHEGYETPRLCYWLREGRSTNAEVDYVISQGDLIAPIEVKAGKSGTLRSLLQFALAKHCEVAVRFDLNPPTARWIKHKVGHSAVSRQARLLLLSLPLYMVGQLRRLLDIVRSRPETVASAAF